MRLGAGHAFLRRRTTQQADDEAAEECAQAGRAALDAMVKALGGAAWLNMKNRTSTGHVAGVLPWASPIPGTTQILEFHAWPDKDRIDVTKHRDVVQFFVGREGLGGHLSGQEAAARRSRWTIICAAATTPSRPQSRSG